MVRANTNVGMNVHHTSKHRTMTVDELQFYLILYKALFYCSSIDQKQYT